MQISIVAFLVGILVVQQQSVLPDVSIALSLIPALAAAVWRPRVGAPLLFFVAGAVWASLRGAWVLAEDLSPLLEGRDLRVVATVADIPVPTDFGFRLVVDVHEAHRDDVLVAVPRRIQLNVPGRELRFEPGEVWQLTVRLRRPHGFQNPGGFDYESQLFQRRIRATGYVRRPDSTQRLRTLDDTGQWNPIYRLNRLRLRLSHRIGELLEGHPFTGMITAFANGDDHGIADPQWEVLTRTGTSHLIAISGMNISLVAGFAYLLVQWLWRVPARLALWVAAPRAATIGALLAATSYAALAGFAIPTQRALIMLAVVFVTRAVAYRTPLSVPLALALFLVLVIDPLSVLSAGFWLSFLAVAVILYALPSVEQATWKQRLAAWGLLQWAVSIGLLPVLLFLFQQVSVTGPLANLIAIPVVETIVIPATLIGVGASTVLPNHLAAIPFALAATALEWLWWPLAWLSQWPGSLWARPTPPVWTLAVAAVGIWLLLLPRGCPGRWTAVVWLLPVVLAPVPRPPSGSWWLTVLDVGQGLAAVVRTRHHTLVYDTGARFSSRFDAGRAVVVPYLRQAGVAQVDRLVISHGDNDHRGGAASLRRALPVRSVVTSVPERVPESGRCVAGEAWEWDGVRFEFVNPPRDSRWKGNDASCVLKVSAPGGRVLLPGDINARAERRLVRANPELLQADVLLVPHHGSRTSSTEAFLEAVQPNVALLAVGYRNRYRHPNPMVIERYRDRGIRLFDTVSSGAIEIQMSDGEAHVQAYRQVRRRYWWSAPER